MRGWFCGSAGGSSDCCGESVLIICIDTDILREEKWAIMSESTVTYMSPEQLQARYNELASRVGDLEEFKVRGANYDLDADDAAIYDELRDLEFLLGRG